ncbi:MAG: peptidase associated/transthyretin-like domain-containing protein [Planctomycetota bacterium]|jgi:hypothetical protein
MKMLKLAGFIVVVAVFLTACTVTHRYGPYSGKVVDAETKEPIAGAAVLIVFYTESWKLTVAGSNFVDAVEVLTDEKGEFKIPVKRLTAVRFFNWWDAEGYVTIFKPGYGCYPTHKDAIPIFEPNGSMPAAQTVVFQLPPLRTREERLSLPALNFDIPYEKQEKLINLINKEMQELGASGKYSKESFIRR